MLRRHCFGGLIEPLGVVHELDVRARIGPACRDVVRVVILLEHHLIELTVQTLLGALENKLGEALELPVLDRVVGGGDRRLDRARGFQPGVRGAFAGAMHAHQGLEKVEVGEFFRFATGLADVARALKRVAQLGPVLLRPGANEQLLLPAVRQVVEGDG